MFQHNVATTVGKASVKLTHAVSSCLSAYLSVAGKRYTNLFTWLFFQLYIVSNLSGNAEVRFIRYLYFVPLCHSVAGKVYMDLSTWFVFSRWLSACTCKSFSELLLFVCGSAGFFYACFSFFLFFSLTLLPVLKREREKKRTQTSGSFSNLSTYVCVWLCA